MMSSQTRHLCEYINEIQDTEEYPLFVVHGSGKSWRAEQVRQRILALGASLKLRLGLQPGDRVCVLARTCPELIETLFSVLLIGCIAVPLNWRWTVQEAVNACEAVGARVVISDKLCAALALAIAERNKHGVNHMVWIGPMENFRDNNDELDNLPTEVWHAEDLIRKPMDSVLSDGYGFEFPQEGEGAFLIFTSGTSGPPKAVLISHKAMHFQCKAKLRCCGYSSSDVYVHLAPLFHVGGLCSALAMVHAGARHVFLESDQIGFSPQLAIEAMIKHKITACIAVPTMIADLVEHMKQNSSKMYVKEHFNTDIGPVASMQKVLIGAGGLQKDLLEEASCFVFPNSIIYGAYGMTEACSSLTYSTLRMPGRSVSNEFAWKAIQAGGMYVGKAAPGIELAIVKPGSEAEQYFICDNGETGEVVTSGPHVMMYYWNDNESTKRSFIRLFSDTEQSCQVWFRTGDIGIMDDENGLWLVGRAKDTIKTGGENVPAAEVERVLLSHKGVLNASVVGVDDRRLGERVFAALVLRKGWSWNDSQVLLMDTQTKQGSNKPMEITSKASERNDNSLSGIELQKYCRNMGLAGFKLPRGFAVLSSFPTNATGKVCKPELKNVIRNRILSMKTQKRSIGGEEGSEEISRGSGHCYSGKLTNLRAKL